MAFTSPTLQFNFCCIADVSVRFQGCEWPFLASSWTQHCYCWGGCRTWRLESVWQLICHVHQHHRIEGAEESESLPVTADLPAAIQSVSTVLSAFVWVRFCCQKGLFLSTHFVYLLTRGNVCLNFKCLDDERFDWCVSVLPASWTLCGRRIIQKGAV